MTDRAAVRERAHQLAQERLLRKRGLLEAVRPDERAAIEEIAYAIASKVADCLLDEAARCPTLAAALTADLPAGASGRRRLRADRSPLPLEAVQPPAMASP
jgi:hypothetical protein